MAAAADAAFVDGLEAVVGGVEPSDAMAARYQRRGGYGHAVIFDVVENATQRVLAAADTDRSLSKLRRLLRRHLVLRAAVAVIPDAELVPGDRVRWRGFGWRERAVETLLDLGAGRCLAEGCNELAERRYCAEHAERERTAIGVPQTNPKLAQVVHDAAIASVSDLLAEIGEALRIPRT